MREKAEKELQASEMMLSTTIDALQDLLVVIDKDFRVVMSNWKDHDYIPEKNGQGHPFCYEAFLGRKKPCNPCHAMEVFASGITKQLEATNLIDGKIRDVHVLPMFDDKGEVIAVIEHLRDITARKQAEESLIESEAKYRELFENESDAVMIFDAETLRFEDANRATLDLYGYSKEEFLTLTVEDISAEKTKTRVAVKKVKDRELDSKYVPLRYFKRKDGSIFPGEICAGTFVTGGRKKIIGAVRDITERVSMQESLQNSENRFHELFNNMRNGVAVFQAVDDGKDFIFVDFNNAAERLDNIKKEDLLGKRLLEMYPGVKEFGLFDVLQSVWRTGKPQHHPINFYEDGRISAWRENYVYRLPSEEIVAVFEDITDRKQMEQTLRESQQRFKSIFENAPIGFYRTTPDGRILDANPALIQILGYTSFEELATVNLETPDYHPEYSRREFQERIERDGEIKGLESFWKRSDGTFRHIRENARAIRDADGNIIQYEGTVEDVNDQRQAEKLIINLSHELIKAQESERQMISRELHDRIAQDLSTLLIGLDTLSDHRPNVIPEVRKKALELSEILKGTIGSVRDLSYELHPPGLDDMGLIQALSMYCDEFAGKSGLKVDFQAIGMSDLGLDFDTEMNLYRLIQEGLNNIRKHAAAKNATVKLIGTYPNIILRIEDDGKGFDIEERTRTADREKRMGLRSMNERVGLIQGEMQIKSQPMKGTRIFIKFPYQEKKHGSKENHIDR
ncbi:MAG: PAS domain S-box protein [Desulfobacterales bacterium]